MSERIIRYFNVNSNEVVGPFRTGRMSRGFKLKDGGKLIRCLVGKKGELIQQSLYYLSFLTRSARFFLAKYI